jgi:hypothetical protein
MTIEPRIFEEPELARAPERSAADAIERTGHAVHALLFAAAAAARARPVEAPVRRCRSGHVVPALYSCCAQCGDP